MEAITNTGSVATEPVAVSATPQPSTTESTPTAEPNIFSEMILSTDEGDVQPTTPPTPNEPTPAAQPAPAPVTAQPLATQAPPVVPTAPAAAPAQAQPATQPSVASQHTQPSVAQTQQQAAQFAQYRETVRTDLEKNLAASLSDADKEAMAVDPASAYPKLMSRAFLDIYDAVSVNMSRSLERMIPALIAQHTHAMQAATSNEQKFFSQFPELAKPEYSDRLLQIAHAYKLANPQAQTDEVIQATGIMARQMFGVAAQAQPQQPVPAQPLATQQPYQPLGTGAASRSMAPPPPPDIWSELLASE